MGTQGSDFSIEDLESKLYITDSEDQRKIAAQFQEIAYNLMNNFVITKSGKIKYRIIELEFYFCSKNHPDIITYPRRAEAGKWFFHNSGVDICLNSNIELTDNHKVINLDSNQHYGGILIRSMKKIELGDKGEKDKYITGPLNCCDELFDQFSAFTTPTDFPLIEFDKTLDTLTMESCGRYFKFSTNLEDKYRSILKTHYQEYDSIKQDMIPCNKERFNHFSNFLEARYRFYLPEEFEKRTNARNEDKTKQYKTYSAEPGQDNKSLFYTEK